MKYCGVTTLFCKVHSAMGMPGSEITLEELMCPVLGDLLQDSFINKIMVDQYCRGTVIPKNSCCTTGSESCMQYSKTIYVCP